MSASNLSKNNLILIGMPGAGKSTVGVILAKLTSRLFLDSDLLIQTSQQASLQQILEQQGLDRLREVEADILKSLSLENHVIATGGSAVYSDAAMQHLRSLGCVIFLDVSLKTLEKRLKNFETRGIARRPGQTLADLSAERNPLYQQYAHLTVTASGKEPEEIARLIVQQLAAAS